MSVCCLLPEGIEAFGEQYFSKYKTFTISFSNFMCGMPCIYTVYDYGYNTISVRASSVHRLRD